MHWTALYIKYELGSLEFLNKQSSIKQSYANKKAKFLNSALITSNAS